MVNKINHFLLLKILFQIFIWVLTGNQIQAQILAKIFKIDTAIRGYYETFDTLANTRVYASEKLTSPTFISKDGEHRIKYLSNGNKNLGVGQTYEWFTLNIAVNFRFINDDDDIKGETRFLDLHTHIIGRPFIVNLYGQFYKGVYLWPESGKNPAGIPYEQRPDIRTRLMGGSVYFVPNWRRFSFAAAITQRDWQKRSAGSPLFGLEFFTGNVSGDSSLIPNSEISNFKRGLIDRLGFVEAAAGAGYGYTLVIKKNWFVHTSITSGIVAGYLKERFNDVINHQNMYFRPNFIVRSSFGYNSNKFNAAAYYFMNRNISGNDQLNLTINTSNTRLIFAYRLQPSQKLKKSYNKLFSLNPKWKKKYEDE